MLTFNNFISAIVLASFIGIAAPSPNYAERRAISCTSSVHPDCRSYNTGQHQAMADTVPSELVYSIIRYVYRGCLLFGLR